MGDDDEVRRLHAELEQLAAEVARLRERLDDRDLDQAARDDALNRAMGGEARRWSPRILDGAAVHRAAMVALTVVTGAPTICESLTIVSRTPGGQRLKAGRAYGRVSETHDDEAGRVQVDLLMQVKRVDRGDVVPEFHVRLVPGLPDKNAAWLENVADRPPVRGPFDMQQVQRGLRWQPGKLILDDLVPGDPGRAACREPQGVTGEGFAEPPGTDAALKHLPAIA